MCFTDAEPPLLRTLSIRGHHLLYRKALAKRLGAEGPLDPIAIDTLARALAIALPPARLITLPHPQIPALGQPTRVQEPAALLICT